MAKVKSPEGLPDSIEFCKKTFKYHKTDDECCSVSPHEYETQYIYKYEHIILRYFPKESVIAVEQSLREPPVYFDERPVLAVGEGSDLKQAVKKAEKEFQKVFYKMKAVMDK
jgi:hypothetical protein